LLALRWHNCPYCSGVFAVIALALPHDANIGLASLLLLRWQHQNGWAGVFAIILLAWLPLLCWHL
jgi:hypothetical protein